MPRSLDHWFVMKKIRQWELSTLRVIARNGRVFIYVCTCTHTYTYVHILRVSLVLKGTVSTDFYIFVRWSICLLQWYLCITMS